ncbi:MAG: hypothetical protein LBB52_00035 [Desulfovibrio sp.]|jgi:hypothetical protein|nr:hypothetical protein [Desulfovibrio sp.]
MSVINTLPAPVVQMGHVEKIVELQQNQPYVQQLVAKETAVQSLKAEREKVAAAPKSAESSRVRERDGGKGGRQPRQENKARDEEFLDVEARIVPEDEAETRVLPAGSLIDIKI